MNTQKMLLTSGHESENSMDVEEIGVYNDLMRSKTKRTVLTGVIDRCALNKSSTSDENKNMAIIEYNGFKIAIPASELGITI